MPIAQLTGLGKSAGRFCRRNCVLYLHVTQGHLPRTERGKTPPNLEMLILLSERFHKSVDWILRGEWH
jgi:transcriptional regulator with XRE-family HTH domain